jgi:hypothetical protein
VRTASRVRLVAAAVLATSLLVLAALPALAQVFGGQEIVSAGPLTRIIVGEDLTCQVAHAADTEFELFGTELGSCGTFVSLGTTVYGPLQLSPTGTPWTKVSQVTNGLQILTVVQAGDSGLRLEQRDSYAVGTQSYRTDMTFTNAGANPITAIVYRAGDCYLQDDDTGYGRVDNGAPACIVDPTEGRRIEQWLPITPGSHYMEAHYGEVYSAIRSQQQLPDTCRCDENVDNGAGLSWPLTLGPGATTVISHDTFFSPVGRGPTQQPFKDSVPDPTKISLDPVVIAQSVAITAGVIVLVPFPSALFNSTLEENYAEVMAGVARLRAAANRRRRQFTDWARRKWADRGAGNAPPPGGQPAPAATAEVAPPIPTPIAAAPDDPVPAAAIAAPFDRWSTPLGMLAFVVASALAYAFLDPTFGFSLNSLATFAGIAIGLVVVLLAYGIPLLWFSRANGLALNVRALPETLIVAIVCVVISRVVNFQPGYLYGLIIGFFFAANIPRDKEGRAEATAAAGSLLVAFVAWVLLAVLRSGAGATDAGFVTALLASASVTVVVAGLENAVFAMLPLRFLPGSAVFEWDRRVWAVLIALGLFGFAHVLLNPSAGYLADTTRTSFFTLIVLLIGFGATSVIFWGWFRFRPKRVAAEPPAGLPPAAGPAA